MSKKIVKTTEVKTYTAPKPKYFIFVGNKYYRRLQPTPYLYKIKDFKKDLSL